MCPFMTSLVLSKHALCCGLQVDNWYTGTQDKTGYIQWKPVCYLKPARARDAGTEVRNYDLQDPVKVDGLNSLMEQSVAMAFYGADFNNTKIYMNKALNVSFGLTSDGFYLKNNYTAW
jgi:hypothetical protein